MMAWQRKLWDDREWVAERVAVLVAMTQDPMFFSLRLIEQSLITMERDAASAYLDVMTKRLALFEPEGTA